MMQNAFNAVNRGGGGIRDGNPMRLEVYWTAKKR